VVAAFGATLTVNAPNMAIRMSKTSNKTDLKGMFRQQVT
jgi:hypothetical protein